MCMFCSKSNLKDSICLFVCLWNHVLDHATILKNPIFYCCLFGIDQATSGSLCPALGSQYTRKIHKLEQALLQAAWGWSTMCETRLRQFPLLTMARSSPDSTL